MFQKHFMEHKLVFHTTKNVRIETVIISFLICMFYMTE